MSQRRLDDFFIRQPVQSKNPSHQGGSSVNNSSNASKRREEYMEIDLAEESKEKNSQNLNKNHHTGSRSQPTLRFPHHTRNLWATRKPHLFSIASRQNCTVESIMQVIYQNIVECRIIRADHLVIDVLHNFLNEFDSQRILNQFALIASYALEVEFLFPQVIDI